MELPIILITLLSAAVPFINAAVQKVNWSPKAKTLIALVVSIVIAVVYLFLTGGIGDWSQLAVVIPTVYALQNLIFQFFLKNIATKFEALTTPGAAVVAPATTEKVTVTSDSTIDTLPENHSVLPVASTVRAALSGQEEIVREDVRG